MCPSALGERRKARVPARKRLDGLRGGGSRSPPRCSHLLQLEVHLIPRLLPLRGTAEPARPPARRLQMQSSVPVAWRDRRGACPRSKASASIPRAQEQEPQREHPASTASRAAGSSLDSAPAPDWSPEILGRGLPCSDSGLMPHDRQPSSVSSHGWLKEIAPSYLGCLEITPPCKETLPSNLRGGLEAATACDEGSALYISSEAHRRIHLMFQSSTTGPGGFGKPNHSLNPENSFFLGGWGSIRAATQLKILVNHNFS